MIMLSGILLTSCCSNLVLERTGAVGFDNAFPFLPFQSWSMVLPLIYLEPREELDKEIPSLLFCL